MMVFSCAVRDLGHFSVVIATCSQLSALLERAITRFGRKSTSSRGFAAFGLDCESQPVVRLPPGNDSFRNVICRFSTSRDGMSASRACY